MTANRKQGKKRMTKRERMYRKRRKQRMLFALDLLIVALMFTGILLVIGGKGKEQKTNDAKGEQKETELESELENELGTGLESENDPDAENSQNSSKPVPTLSISDIQSKAGILVRLEDGQVVAEKEADAVIYPASMTKIMTAIVGLENISDLSETILITREMYDRLYLEGASLAGFGAGDQVQAIDILYGVMLPSGAECCVGLAEHLFGSEEAFVGKMNEKAQELGMEQTHFVTSTGLHDVNHYTTVRDMTKLLSYALKNDTFRTIYCSASYTTNPTASAPEGLHFLSTMFKHMSSASVNGGEIEGGKTGYTSDAGQCLASLANVDGTEYILVTAGAPGSPSTGSLHIEDAQYVYNQIQAAE